MPADKTIRTPEVAPLAAVTMVFDEPSHLRSWTRHYVREVGAANCTVVDHGSDPALIARWQQAEGAGVNLLRLPRSPQDDTRRAAFLSRLCASLLGYYGAVLYTDCDELVVAEPDRYASLADYARALAVRPDAPEVVTAIGCEVIHRSDEEPAFDALSLFHLRFADEADGLARLARTRAQPWAEETAGAHQRMPDADWLAMLRSMAALPVDRARRLDAADAELARWLDRLRESDTGNRLYRYALDIAPMMLWELPERFRGRL